MSQQQNNLAELLADQSDDKSRALIMVSFCANQQHEAMAAAMGMRALSEQLPPEFRHLAWAWEHHYTKKALWHEQEARMFAAVAGPQSLELLSGKDSTNVAAAH
jgi:hypothetical protein